MSRTSSTRSSPIIDQIFDGGIPCGSITEIVGESGVGKTQLTLQLLLNVQLPFNRGGLSASSLYLHTEFPFPFRRLHQIAFHRAQLEDKPFDKVFIQPLHSLDTLLDILPRLESVIYRMNIKLIVIDSIAALFRGEFANNPKALKERLHMFFKISIKLRSIAFKFGLAIVVTNQVTDVIPNSNVFRIGEWMITSGRNVSAALGISWANCVNTRVFMSFVEKKIKDAKDNHIIVGSTRRLQIVFAPHLTCIGSEYVVAKQGICGVQSSK